jgi:hypothetical protein
MVAVGEIGQTLVITNEARARPQALIKHTLKRREREAHSPEPRASGQRNGEP